MATPIRTRTVAALALAMLLHICLVTIAHAEEPEPFAGYKELCGYQIIYWPTRQLALSHITPDERKVIILDPILRLEQEHPRRLFLTAHECAHHRMDHSSKTSVEKRVSTQGEVSRQELSADCWAAGTLVRAGHQDAIETIAMMFYQSGEASPGNGYPPGTQRALMIKRCGDAETASNARGVRQIARNGAILSVFD